MDSGDISKESSPAASPAVRKVPLEELSKEELLKKYKGAILIAQKAKLAKDEAADEIVKKNLFISTLEEKLQASEHEIKKEGLLTQKLQEQLQATQELLASQQKLHSETEAMVEERVADLTASIKTENSELLKELNIMNQVLKQRGELISKMTASHADYTRQIDELEVSLSNTTKELHLKTAELENMADFTRQLAELKSTLSTMSKDILEKDKQIEALTASQKETESINEELKQKTALLDQLQSTHEGERSELLKKLNEREICLSEIQEKMQMCQSQVVEVSSNHEKEMQTLKSELNSKTNELENCAGLQEKISDLQEKLKKVTVEKEDAMVALKEELASLKNQIEENRTLEETQDKNEALFDQISELQSQLETYKIQCTNLMEELQSRDTDLEQLQTFKVALTEKEIELRVMQENLLKEAEEKLCLAQFKSELESQLLALEETVLSEKKRSSELERLCSEKDHLIQELKVAKDEVSSVQAETINFNTDRIRSLEDQLFNLNQTVEIKDKTIEDLQINLQQNSERMEAYRVQVTVELEQLNETKGRNEDLLTDLNHQLKLSEERINDKDLKMSDLVKSLDSLSLQLEEVQMQLIEKDGIIKMYEVEVSKLKSELSCLNESVSNEENVLINDKLKEKDEIIKSKDMCISNLSDENEKIQLALQNVLTETKSTLSNNSMLYEELKSELCAKIEGLETEISKQRDEIAKLNTDKQQMTNDQLCTLASLKDLEMQKDTIQAKYEASVERENDLMKQLTVLQEALQAKEASLQQLEQELSKLKEAAPHEMAYTEISSTYSMSHTEEQARLRDLEDSFEDKYTKLRVVAVKLKRRVSELTQTLESERNKMSSEKSELQAKLAQVANHAKTTQTLQSEVDRLQDMLEDQRKCQQKLSRDLDTAVQDGIAAKSQLESMQEQLHEVIQERNSLQTSKDNLEAALSHAEALSSETDRLCKEIREKELLLEQSTEEKRKLAEQLEKACADAKKKSVLSLEIDDMEKSVFELTQQLNTEKTLSRSISCELDQERVLTSNLREQLKTLEEVAQERQQSIAALDEKLLHAKMEVEEYKNKCMAQDILCKQLQAQLEAQQSVVEGLNLQCADLAAKQVQTSETARQQIEALGRQVYQLEEQCSALRDSNGVTEAELAALRTEFEGYKVRAQSVLRQSNRQEERSVATRAVHDAEELELEVERLRVTLNNLKTTHQKTMTQLESALQEANIEREEKARAFKACQSLRETCSLATERQHSAEEKLSAALEDARQAKLHAEMLMQCYKQQIEDLKTAHSKKVTNLTEQLENLQATVNNNLNASEIDKSPSLRSGSGPSPVAEWASSAATSSHPDPELHRMSSLTREEGEGSESVDSFPSRRISVTTQERRHELVPLDKLLSSSSYPEDEGSVAAELASSTQLNIDTLQTKLNACEARASHLTALLSEAESDAARLSQLNTVLKEEIRRQQRSEERTQHAHNLEYLKNIVVKFITLQNGDERLRLIPVLNTILKLSPEEAEMITSVAKGTPQSTTGARGWGSYLPIPGWSGS